MAKANNGSKSQKIRDYLAQHPNARPSEVAEALSEIGVTPAFAALIKARSDSGVQPGRRKKRPKHLGTPIPAKSPKRPRGKQQKVNPVLLATKLILVCGGVDEAHAVLQEAARLRVDLHPF